MILVSLHPIAELRTSLLNVYEKWNEMRQNMEGELGRVKCDL